MKWPTRPLASKSSPLLLSCLCLCCSDCLCRWKSHFSFLSREEQMERREEGMGESETYSISSLVWNKVTNPSKRLWRKTMTFSFGSRIESESVCVSFGSPYKIVLPSLSSSDSFWVLGERKSIIASAPHLLSCLFILKGRKEERERDQTVIENERDKRLSCHGWHLLPSFFTLLPVKVNDDETRFPFIFLVFVLPLLPFALIFPVNSVPNDMKFVCIVYFALFLISCVELNCKGFMPVSLESSWRGT